MFRYSGFHNGCFVRFLLIGCVIKSYSGRWVCHGSQFDHTGLVLVLGAVLGCLLERSSCRRAEFSYLRERMIGFTEMAHFSRKIGFGALLLGEP